MLIQNLLTIFQLITILFYLSSEIAYGQMGTNGTTTWVDRENDIKIVFRISPTPPVTGTPAELGFGVQNLQTGQPVTNLVASVTILTNSSGQETASRLVNIIAPNGHFTITYIFPDLGLYQVITRINSHMHGVASLASFIIVVPPQVTDLLGVNYILWISFMIAIAAGVVSFLVVRNRVYSDYQGESTKS